MASAILFICIFLTEILAYSPGASQPMPEYRRECIVFNNVTNMLTSMTVTGLVMSCSKNRQCTGFDCTGETTLGSLISSTYGMDIKFCYGMALHPCDDPFSVSVYLDLPDNDVHFQQKVMNDGLLRIPGAHVDYGLGQADGFLYVTMEPKSINGQRYVKIGLKLKWRMTIASFEQWPEAFDKTLMPNTSVPIPVCDKKVVTPTHAPRACQKYTTFPSQAPKFTTVPTKDTTKYSTKSSSDSIYQPPTTKQASGRKGQLCKQSEFNACGPNEMCDYAGISKVVTRCQCIPTHRWNKDKKKCVASASTDNIIPEPILITDPSPKSHIYAIVGGVLGIVLIIGIIAGVLAYRRLKFRERYGQHELLASNEEDDPLEVAT